MKIRKAVIPAAGLGTRFLPATKAVPKEMLPIVDTPTIQYIVSEAVNSGIEEIIIVISPRKEAIKNHFEVNGEYEHYLREIGKTEYADKIHEVAKNCKITYVLQKEMKGLGNAILCAKEAVGNEPFGVLLGDDLVINPNGEPALKQLIADYEKYHCTILGVQTVDRSQIYKYGCVIPQENGFKEGRTTQLSGVVEKPKCEEAPSLLAILGRYVFTPTIFKYIEETPVSSNGEVMLTDAMCDLLKEEKIYAYDFIDTRYDAGDKFGFVKAVIDFSLMRDDLKEQVSNYIKEVSKKL